MPLIGYDFVTGPFQNVSYLIEQNDLLFKAQIIPKGGPDQYMAAVDRIIAHRKWTDSAMLIKPRLEAVLREQDIFYVPKQLAPGPCFVFIHTDVSGRKTRAQIRPLYELLVFDLPVKYAELGKKFEFIGPIWIGNSEAMMKRIMQQRMVVLVEGGFDQLASRLVAPDVPVLSATTKSLNEMHFDFLKILGVKTIHFLFDRERPGEMGGGEKSSRHFAKKAAAMGFDVTEVRCALSDPSACLESFQDARRLKKELEILL